MTTASAELLALHDACVMSRNDYCTAKGEWDKRRFREQWKDNEAAFRAALTRVPPAADGGAVVRAEAAIARWKRVSGHDGLTAFHCGLVELDLLREVITEALAAHPAPAADPRQALTDAPDTPGWNVIRKWFLLSPQGHVGYLSMLAKWIDEAIMSQPAADAVGAAERADPAAGGRDD